VTNEGTLSAVNTSILRIANLAAPNTGIVAAAAGSSVQFTGAFAQASTGTTRVDIAGTSATQFGLVAVTGAATLAGTLNVHFASGYTPAAGSTFKIVTYGSRSGQFDNVQIFGLAAGLSIMPQYNATDITLTVVAASPAMAAAPKPTEPESAQSVVPPSGGGAFAGKSNGAASPGQANPVTPSPSRRTQVSNQPYQPFVADDRSHANNLLLADDSDDSDHANATDELFSDYDGDFAIDGLDLELSDTMSLR
jgi:hypothetical protein